MKKASHVLTRRLCHPDESSRHEAARRCKVGDACVIRWVAVQEASGQTQPLTSGGDKRSKLKPHRDWLLALGRRKDLTLEAVAGMRRHRR